MLFNSSQFVAFFAIVYVLYLLFRRSVKAQNVLLLVASYVFYGSWNWRFLSLIAISTLIDYTVGLRLERATEPRARKLLLAISVIANLSILGFFKYFNFFAESAVDLLHLLGMQASYTTLHIVLPVGISFYTFQTMSYTIDVYRGELKPTRNLLDFALFVSFFPQLVAGPIERAVNLLPQVQKARSIRFEQVQAGAFLILWGYFKKMVVADNMGLIADQVFNHYTDHHGLALLVGVLAFTFQIFGDFSGYSDIARGVSKLMGFELMVNFRLPYFALNPSDFWARWHISLSSWLRDYLYIPLGGNRKGSGSTLRNLALTMLLGGLWHGASWNFVLWGGFHGAILIAYRLWDKHPEHLDPWGGRYSYPRVLAKMLLMFTLTVIGWILFRAHTLHQIGYFFSHIGFAGGHDALVMGGKVLFYLVPFLGIQLIQYVKRDLLFPVKWHWLPQGALLAFLMIWIAVFSVRESIEFIYFQF